MNESCHTYEWVMSHIWMSHVTHMNESCHTYEWFMSHVSHIWMIHVAHINESWHTYEWVMSLITVAPAGGTGSCRRGRAWFRYECIECVQWSEWAGAAAKTVGCAWRGAQSRCVCVFFQYIHTYIHTYIYIYIYMYIHKYIHTPDDLDVNVWNANHEHTRTHTEHTNTPKHKRIKSAGSMPDHPDESVWHIHTLAHERHTHLSDMQGRRHKHKQKHKCNPKN